MIRSNSSSKWKQVLGFDDGLPPSVVVPSLKSGASIDLPKIVSPSDATYQSRFPRYITFTRTKQQDLYFSSSSIPSACSLCEEQPADIHIHTEPPLFYAKIQHDTSPPIVASPKPDIVLYAGPSKSASIISFAMFSPVTQSTEITLCPLPPRATQISIDSKITNPPVSTLKNFSLPSNRKFRTEKLVSTGGIYTTEKHGFYHTFPETPAREKFEWRQSSDSDVAAFLALDAGIESGGWKLVRISTAESVALYAGLRKKANGPSVVGLFRFLGEGDCGRRIGGLGEEFEVLALISLLSVLEKGRRSVMENRLAWGVD